MTSYHLRLDLQFNADHDAQAAEQAGALVTHLRGLGIQVRPPDRPAPILKCLTCGLLWAGLVEGECDMCRNVPGWHKLVEEGTDDGHGGVAGNGPGLRPGPNRSAVGGVPMKFQVILYQLIVRFGQTPSYSPFGPDVTVETAAPNLQQLVDALYEEAGRQLDAHPDYWGVKLTTHADFTLEPGLTVSSGLQLCRLQPGYHMDDLRSDVLLTPTRMRQLVAEMKDRP